MNNQQLRYSKSSTGRWGAFTYDLEVYDTLTKKHYINTYRNFCLSNLFLNTEKVKNGPVVFMALPDDQSNENNLIQYYTIASKQLSPISLFFHILAYRVTAQPYLFLLPVILVGALFKSEFKREYTYQSRFHKLMMNISFGIIIFGGVLTALY